MSGLRKALLIAGLLVTLLHLRVPIAQADVGNMESANAAYQRGDYQAAIAGYEVLVGKGVVHEDLFYNLGNANFRAGRFGHAIFNYERALRIAPGQADSLYNLDVAREVVAADTRNQLRGAEFMAWWVRLALYFSTSQTTLALFLLNFSVFAGLLVLRFWAGGLVRTGLIVLLSFLGAATLTSAGLLAAHVYVYEKVLQGVVVGDSVTMREGPDAALDERGQLHAGLHVRVLAEEPSWLLVRLANGVEGWVPREEIGLF